MEKSSLEQTSAHEPEKNLPVVPEPSAVSDGNLSSEDKNFDHESLSSNGYSTKEDVNEKYVHRGVARIDAINETMSEWKAFNLFGYRMGPLRILLIIALLLHGYTTGLDGNMSQLTQTYAASGFHAASLNAAMNTTKSVVGAAVFVPYSRISDRFGRIECWIGALILFIIGRVVSAAAPNVGSLFVGIVFWELGYAAFRYLATISLADMSQLRDRTFFLNIYEIQILINWGVSGLIVKHVANSATHWRWGYGIGCIDVPFTAALVIVTYAYAQWITYKEGRLPSLRLKLPGQSWSSCIKEFVIRVDFVGILLFAGGLALFLVSLTLAGGYHTKWRRAYIIAMIVVGGCLLFLFGIWDLFLSPTPFIPRKRLERTFYFGLAIDVIWRLAVSIELDNVSFILLVAFGQTSTSAQRLAGLYNFMQSATSIVLGVILHYVMRPKPFVVAGQFIGLLGMGIMYKYRTYYDGLDGYKGADALVGLGGGMTRFPMWTLIHASVPHNQMASVTSFLMSMYQVGAAVGSAVGGAIWTQKLERKLVQNLGPQLGAQFYNSPTQLLKKYPMGSETRDLVLDAYSYIQHLLIITSIALTALCCVLTFGLRAYVCGKQQSLTDEEREEQKKKMDASPKAQLRTAIGAW